MAKIITNYSWGKMGAFRQKFTQLVDFRVADIEDCISVAGESLGWNDLEDGTFISTMPLKNISTEEVKTFGNVTYKLKQIHPEYDCYLKAIDNNIPIMTDIYVYGNKGSWYTIFGVINGNHVAGRVKAQEVEENILTVRMFYGETIDVFPDWESNQFKKTIFGRLGCTDLKMKNLKRFCGADKVKIIFPFE